MITRNEIIQSIQTHDVKYIRLMFTDMLGIIKSVEVPSNKIDKVLNNEQMFDGSSIEGLCKNSKKQICFYIQI